MGSVMQVKFGKCLLTSTDHKDFIWDGYRDSFYRWASSGVYLGWWGSVFPAISLFDSSMFRECS